MPGRRVNFCATKSDILRGLTILEKYRPLKYTLCDIYDSEAEVISFESITTLETLGINTTGDNNSETYLILDREEPVNIRPVPQTAGGIRYFVDQLWNSHSVTLQPGGLYDGSYLVCGFLGTASTDPISVELFSTIRRELVKGFKKVDGYYVGPEAIEVSKRDNLRLITMSIKESLKYDLTL